MQALGRAGDADAADDVAVAAEDRRCKTHLAEHRLFPFDRVAAFTNALELAGESRHCRDRATREFRQPRVDDVAALVLADVCEHSLPERGGVHRQHRADLEDLERCVRPENVVHNEHAVAMRDTDANRLARARREQLGPGERARAQLVEVEVAVRQLQELGAELVLVAVRVLLDEPVVVQGAEQPVDGALRQA